ncbi:peroxiredoxin [Candidatus Neomarinimicrobiota bacterium]
MGKKTLIVSLGFLLISIAYPVTLFQSDGPAVGQLAPNFTLPDQDRRMHDLRDYRGQRVLVYFYSKDDTPGCTREACGLRDSYAEYQALAVTILGISYDTPESHREFKDKYDLPFDLLSDQDKTTAEVYGTKGIFPLAARRSFLLDENGILLKVIDDVDVTTHSEEVLSYFRQLP